MAEIQEKAVWELIADLGARITRLEKAINEAINELANMHDESEDCAFHGGEGCLACLCQTDLATALEAKP